MPGYAENVGGGTRQEGPKAFASTYCGVTHRIQKAGAGIGGYNQHSLEQCVDVRRNFRKR
jgi:hypothetical protein